MNDLGKYITFILSFDNFDNKTEGTKSFENQA